jgi:hypothetical protein
VCCYKWRWCVVIHDFVCCCTWLECCYSWISVLQHMTGVFLYMTVCDVTHEKKFKKASNLLVLKKLHKNLTDSHKTFITKIQKIWINCCMSVAACGSVDVPTGVVVTYSSDGLIMTFTCVAGFHLVGLSSIKCQNGSWDGEPPRCYRGNDLFTL